MAEKIRVKIDLSQTTQNSDIVTSIASAPPEIVYHYDRIFVALIVTIGLLYTVYHFIFSDYNNNNVTDKLQPEQTLSATTDAIDNVKTIPQKDADVLTGAIPEEVITPSSTLQASADQPGAEATEAADNTVLQPVETAQNLDTEQQQARSIEKSHTTAKESAETDKNIPISSVQDKPETAETVANTVSQSREQAIDNTPLTDAATVSKTRLPRTETAATAPDSQKRSSPITTVDSTARHFAAANKSAASAATVKIFSSKLSRAQLTSSVYKKEPVDTLPALITGSADQATKVYFFTQLDNSKGSTIEHQWWYKDKLVSRRKITAWGNRWRCYSSKNLGKYRQGEWQVRVVDKNGKLLAEAAFEFKI